MIDVKNISRYYGSFAAVDDVSFHIGHGEVVGLLGHNGAGKTTIMKMLTGFLEPTQGRILVDGQEISQEQRAIQAKIGYLPENCPLWPEMTVVDYLDYQATLHGIPEEQKPSRIRQAILRTALTEKATQTIHTLSRGYRQRVGVAQAILHHPKIIILDEPTNGLDPTQIRQMRSLIQDLSTVATVIVSTHILQEVQAVCKRVLILRSGKLVVDSLLEDLQRNQRIRIVLDQDESARLATIPGVESVDSHESVDKRHIFVVTADLETAPLIASTLIESKVRLFSLEPEKQDLESLFARVNEGDIGEEGVRQ